jgi:hypothetical protein
MRILGPAAITVFFFAPDAGGQAAPAKTWSFDADKADAPPAGFSFARTGSGAPGRWVVKAGPAPGGNVLAQLDADATDNRFPVAIAESAPLADLVLRAKCRPVSGKVDQACGLVFRYRDENNYYVTRANALENNVRLYFVKDGQRKQFASWSGKVTAGAWHDLQVEARGDHFVVSWDGKKVIEASDKTFAQAGKVGLWTKADSVTWFDDLRAEPLGGGGAAPPVSKPALDTARIEQLTGLTGAYSEKEGVFKVQLPRTDLKVRAAGVKMTPRLGLTAWAAFARAGGHTIVMGDLVLLEDQVNQVMSAALDAGLEVTALHNHFFWDTPKVMFMHIGGMGDEAALAGAVGKVFAKLKATAGGKGPVPRAAIDPARTKLDAKKLDGILGVEGELKDGVYKIAVGRTARMHGADAGNAMGVNTWAAFAGTEDKAVVDGDVAMRESELQAVLKALRGSGILIVAIHQHMTHEEPRTMFLHYWGVGRAEDLAKGVRAALDLTRGR